MFTRYAVEIGDALWTALYNHVENNYSIESVCQEDEQIFAVLTSDNKYYRLNISVVDNEYIFAAEMDELTDYTPGEEPQFAAADVEAYAKKEEIEVQPEEEPAVCGDPVEEPVTVEPAVVIEEEVKPAYVLDEIPEYVELQARYAQLENELNQLKTDKDALETQVQSLSQFKKQIEKKEKETMINSFYMLSDEDKQDVITNIDTYSLDDIEAKLSIICVRNRVSFNSDDIDLPKETVTTYSLDNNAGEDASTPAWVKAAMRVAKTIN